MKYATPVKKQRIKKFT